MYVFHEQQNRQYEFAVDLYLKIRLLFQNKSLRVRFICIMPRLSVADRGNSSQMQKESVHFIANQFLL